MGGSHKSSKFVSFRALGSNFEQVRFFWEVAPLLNKSDFAQLDIEEFRVESRPEFLSLVNIMAFFLPLSPSSPPNMSRTPPTQPWTTLDNLRQPCTYQQKKETLKPRSLNSGPKTVTCSTFASHCLTHPTVCPPSCCAPRRRRGKKGIH